MKGQNNLKLVNNGNPIPSVRNRTCCFTGHRNIPSEYHHTVQHQLEVTITNLINQGVIYFGAGGALGFDTLAAQTVIKLRKTHPIIKLILVLPCLTQASRWSPANKHIYEGIKKEADKIIYVSTEYTDNCMLIRNRHLVNCSSKCVCYLVKEAGGTAYTVNYAAQNGLEIINLAEL